ncbi:MAG: MotA/TolQ/ExbB proton channel family protein [Acidobacteria bacterium]|nr:MotA/TolQ/ExbB proton channel family protein [Acidobacteriota bacterium]
MNGIDLIELLRQTTPVTQVVLAFLLILSVWSWGIILSKALLLRKIDKESGTFWKIFRKGQNLSEILTASEVLHFTPLVAVLNTGVELLEPRKGKTPSQGSLPLKSRTANVAALHRVLQRATAAQVTRLESRMTFLATTASVAPFVGLFGTVWGVMTSFAGLANANVATLRAVAPGIADALIATAFGLFAAIPAVIAYNQFVYRLRNIGGQLDDLQAELLAIAEGDSE